MRNHLKAAVLALFALLLVASFGANNAFAAACTCQQAGSSTSGKAVLGSWVACTTSSSACTVTVPGGTGLHHLELQNQCASTAYVQFNGITAVANQGVAVFQAASPANSVIYDITNGAAAIPPPGTTTGMGLVPNGPLSVIGGSCSLNFDILVY